MYSSKRIADLLQKKGVIPIKVDLTSKSPRTLAGERLLHAYGGRSIPFMVLHPGGADWDRPWRFRDLVTRGEVAKALETLPDGVLVAR